MNVLLFNNTFMAGNNSLLEFGIEWVEEAIKRPDEKNAVYSIRDDSWRV